MKILALSALLALGLVAGCASTPATDPDHNVSNASYRKALEQIEADTAQIVSKLDDVENDSIANVATGGLVKRPSSWWAVERRLAGQVNALVHDTLAGATK